MRLHVDEINADLLAGLASAFAAIVLATFAGIQLRQEHMKRKDQAKTARVRLSGSAYLLRARLHRWLGVMPQRTSSTPLADWIREMETSATVIRELSAGRDDVRGMLEIAADASESQANATRTTYVNYLEGARRLEEHVSTSRPSDANQFWSWIQLLSDADDDFRACIRALENEIIEPFLLNSEGSMRRKREDEEPFGQLGRALTQEFAAENANHADEIPRDQP